MPFTHRHAFGNVAFISQGLGRLMGPASMTFTIAPGAGRDDVLWRVTTAIPPRDKMLRGVLQFSCLGD
jgi:hypothetical protein